jgi:hypothetical protein
MKVTDIKNESLKTAVISYVESSKGRHSLESHPFTVLRRAKYGSLDSEGILERDALMDHLRSLSPKVVAVDRSEWVD